MGGLENKMLVYNFILPASGSMTFDGTIIIAIATIFVVAYLYKNRNNLKSKEVNREINRQTDTKTIKSSNSSIKEENIENTQELHRNPNLSEEEVLVEEQERLKIHN